ncbi:putative germin-like protein 2-1 [Silene latifolia]|uniref:putative germin-like protein 2-1 n=1 Tax=Silene latifolia TaxID=37657 RepID=UPI003D780DD8
MVKLWETCVAMLVICMAFAMSFHYYKAGASDPAPLQDFCIGVNDPNSAVIVNGLLCKNPKKVTSQDFVFNGFNQIGDTNNVLGSNVTVVDVTLFPGLNTQGVSVAHVDFGPFGLNTPHHHPRASEILTVISGTIYVGLVTTEYELFSAVLNTGDLFVFPQGLVHFQLNLENTTARVNTAFGSQHPGRVDLPQSLFGVMPKILDDVLTKAYQVDKYIVEELRYQFDALNGIEIERSSKKNE